MVLYTFTYRHDTYNILSIIFLIIWNLKKNGRANRGRVGRDEIEDIDQKIQCINVWNFQNQKDVNLNSFVNRSTLGK